LGWLEISCLKGKSRRSNGPGNCWFAEKSEEGAGLPSLYVIALDVTVIAARLRLVAGGEEVIL
jgi:hypothetical protein